MTTVNKVLALLALHIEIIEIGRHIQIGEVRLQVIAEVSMTIVNIEEEEEVQGEVTARADPAPQVRFLAKAMSADLDHDLIPEIVIGGVEAVAVIWKVRIGPRPEVEDEVMEAEVDIGTMIAAVFGMTIEGVRVVGATLGTDMVGTVGTSVVVTPRTEDVLTPRLPIQIHLHHLAKMSKKHIKTSRHSLRISALFSLRSLYCGQPRRIFVDTSVERSVVR